MKCFALAGPGLTTTEVALGAELASEVTLTAVVAKHASAEVVAARHDDARRGPLFGAQLDRAEDGAELTRQFGGGGVAPLLDGEMHFVAPLQRHAVDELLAHEVLVSFPRVVADDELQVLGHCFVAAPRPRAHLGGADVQNVASVSRVTFLDSPGSRVVGPAHFTPYLLE